MSMSSTSTPTKRRTAAAGAGAGAAGAAAPSSVCTPSPLREGKELWTITKRLESRGSEGKEALDSMHETALTYMRACFSHAKRRLMEDPRPVASSAAAAAGDASAMDHSCASPNGASPSQPRAPPNTAAAGGPSSVAGASKRQRRSVAEAAQVAQVRQKVALFESFKGAAAAAAASATAAGGASPSTSPAARPLQGSGGKGSMGSASSGSASVGSSSYHAVFPGLDLFLTSMPSRAALFASAQPSQPQQQTAAARASEEKVDAVVAPVEASRDDVVGAGAPPTQQITAAMRELRIAETEKQEPMEEEGPEPIIECNHKQPVLALAGGRGASGGGAGHAEGGGQHQPQQPSKPSAEHQPQAHHETGGFFGMVQKTLGLGKHRASSTGGAQQQQAQPPPAAALSPPLSPLRPENTYQMSDSDEERGDDESDFSSDDEDGEGRPRRGRRAHKKVPAWARGQALAAALEAQFTADPQLWVDPDSIFPEPPTTCNLEEIFKVRKKRYYKRTSSGLWEQDGLTLSEKLAYKRDVSGKK